MKYDSNKIYYSVQNGLNISKNIFDIYMFDDDGNSFYKCLSVFLYDKLDYSGDLRKLVLTYCKENIKEIIKFKDKIEVRNGIFIDTKDYIENMDINEDWSNEIDIIISII